MTPIEKRMLAAIAVILCISGFWFFYSMHKTIQYVDENGGLKAVMERVWEGKSNDSK